MKRTSLRIGLAAFIGAASHDAALAGGTQPGDSSGQAYAVPIPEGVYFWTTPSYGTRPNGGGASGVDANSFVNVPVFAWSTPWTPLGGRLEFAVTIPEVFEGFPSDTGRPSPSSARGLYNSLFAGIWAFDLGHGFNVSVLSGFYIPENPGVNGVSTDAWVAREGLNFAYNADGWKAAANINYQFQGWNYLTHSSSANDNFVYDLTLTKTIGKWEIGPVGFGSNEVNQAANPHPTAQFALGGLLGYDFGPVTAQFYVTRDLAQRNLGGVETRVWSRLIVPLWSPTPAPPLAAKY
jgi:hypothetical protein